MRMPRMMVYMVSMTTLIVAARLVLPRPSALHVRPLRSLMEEARTGMVDAMAEPRTVFVGPAAEALAHSAVKALTDPSTEALTTTVVAGRTATDIRITVRCSLDVPVTACSVETIEALAEGKVAVV